MTKLEQLIADLCPNGVEYKKLGEIATISRGGNLQKKDFRSEGVPCIHYGQIYTRYGLFADKTFTFISEDCAIKQKMAYTNDIVMAVTSENIEDVCKCVAWLGEDAIAVSGHTAIIHHNQNAKYLTYYFHTEMFAAQKRKLVHGTKVMEVTPDTLNAVMLPVPPLPVQSEIVQILDNFTELMAGLTEKLAEELTARKKQYRYYMDLLLATEGTEHSLEDVCLIVDCPHTSPKWKDSGVPVVRNYNLVNGVIDTTNLSYVDEEEYKIRIKRITPQEDDILFSREAPIGNVGIVPKAFRCCQGQRVVLLRPQKDIVFPQFLLYVLQSRVVHEQIERVGKIGSTVSNFNISDLKKLRFTIPSIEVQMTISEKLDVFSKLCADIFEGLSVEIEARQKQYEYYRDRLLTFKEALI